MTVLIVGCGNIGSKLYDEYKQIHPDRYDPKKGLLEKKNIKYDVAFICVDTPMNDDGSCDLRQVETAITETNAEVYVLRSTVPPTTTDKLKEKTQKRIVFSPEFYGITQHSDDRLFDFDFTILGGDIDDCGIVIQLLQHVYTAKHRFCITDSVCAEIAKYMENTMLATKVSMCIQFYRICQQFGARYETVRELVLQDERIGRAHTFVYADKPYWESHCFDKDLLAVTKFCHAPFVKAVIEYNNDCKKEAT